MTNVVYSFLDSFVDLLLDSLDLFSALGFWIFGLIVGLIGLIGLISVFGLIGLIGHIGLIGLI